MPTLPASVRLSLWATAALARRDVTLEEAVSRATPDVPEVDGAAAVARLDLWAQLGERTVLVTLPAPGDLVGLPRGAEAVSAAVEAGECAWSPLFGGALVPTFEEVGPVGDVVEVVRWAAHEATAPPAHLTAESNLRDAERALRTSLLEVTTALEDLDAPTWRAGLQELTEERLGRGRWGLPGDVDDAAARVIAEAATVGVIVETVLETVHDAPSAALAEQRDRLLRTLGAQARRSLAAATCVAATRLAG